MPDCDAGIQGGDQDQDVPPLSHASTLQSEPWSFIDDDRTTQISRQVCSRPYERAKPTNACIAGVDPEDSRSPQEVVQMAETFGVHDQPTTQSKSSRKFLRRYRRVAALQREFRHTREQYETDLAKTQQARKSYNVSQRAAQDLLAKAVDGKADMSGFVELYRAIVAVQVKCEAFEEQLCKQEHGLIQASHRLGLKGRQLSEALTTVAQILSPETLPFAPEQASPSQEVYEVGSIHDASNDDVSPAVLDYYSALADLDIMTERLQSLHFDYHEERAVRTFKQDQEAQLATTDDDFEQSWTSQLDLARSAYEQALTSTHAAWDACQSQGIMIDAEHDSHPVYLEAYDLEDFVPHELLPPIPPSIEPARLSRVQSEQHLSIRTTSIARSSAPTGNIWPEVRPVQPSHADKARLKASVESWIHSTLMEATNDDTRRPTHAEYIETSQGYEDGEHDDSHVNEVHPETGTH